MAGVASVRAYELWKQAHEVKDHVLGVQSDVDAFRRTMPKYASLEQQKANVVAYLREYANVIAYINAMDAFVGLRPEKEEGG